MEALSKILEQADYEDLVQAFRCVQCGKCSSGCPVAFETPHSPRKLMRFIQWGWLEEAGRSPFVKLCVQCQACTVRCPKEVPVSEVILSLHRLARGRRWIQADAFHSCFERMVRKRGRIKEAPLGIVAQLGRTPPHPWQELVLLVKMVVRRKLL